MSGRVRALLYLAWALVLTLLRRAFGRELGGLALFHANYDADRLPAVTPGERADLSTFGGCIACGRCDDGDGAIMAAPGGDAFPGTMAWVLSSTRSMPDYDAATRAVAAVPPDAWPVKEALCPTHVPLARLVAFVRAKATD